MLGRPRLNPGAARVWKQVSLHVVGAWPHTVFMSLIRRGMHSFFRKPSIVAIASILATVIMLWLLKSIPLFTPVKADTTVVSDTFTRSVSSGWGSANTGGTYTITGTASDFNVSGSEGTINAPLSTSRWAVLTDISHTNEDITVKLKTDKTASGTSQELFVIGRYLSSTNMYRAKIRLTPSSGVTVQGSKVVSGTETLLATQQTVSGLTYTPGVFINVRMRLTGTSPTTFEIKAWADGAGEPGSWTYSTTDSESVLQAAGAVGVRVNIPGSTSNAPILFSFDDFSVSTSDVIPTPTPTPTPPPQSGLALLSDTFTRSASNGWGTSTSGAVYDITSGSASNFNVDGAKGSMLSSTASVSRAINVRDVSQQDVDLQFSLASDKVPIGAAAEAFWLARRIDAGTMYRGKIRLTTTGSITIQATKVVDGVETSLGTQTSTGYSLTSNTDYMTRMQVTGTNPTTINMKLWLATDSEPADWQYTVTDSQTELQQVGGIGFRTNVPSGVTNAPLTISFDNINATTMDGQINTISAPAQTGEVVVDDTYTRTTSNSWGSADTGGSYTIYSGSPSHFATNGSIGTIDSSVTTVLPNTVQHDIDGLYKTKIDKIPIGGTVEIIFLARSVSPSLMYRNKLRINASAGASLVTARVVDGTETNLSSSASTGITYTPNTYLWVRTQVVGSNPTTIYMKAWTDGSSEPSTWQYITYDYNESALQDAGAVGFRTNVPAGVSNGPILFSFDSLHVTTTDQELYDPNSAPGVSPTPTIPSAISATINWGSGVTSQLNVGATHTQESIISSGDATAISNAKTLLSQGVSYQNQHIIGWGAGNLWDDPSKPVDQWNWSSLDNRIKLMRQTGATPIITLCCAATWMVDPSWYPGKYNGSNTDWGQLEKAPLDIYEDDFAYMVQQVVQRYNGVTLDNESQPFPKVERFQVWNEMKGFWSSSLNHWDYDKYNRIYGLVYDTIKADRPEAQIGGPYVRLSRYLYPSGVKNSTLKGDDYGTVDKRDLDVISQWLSWLDANRDGGGNIKAQFVTIDGSITTKDVLDGSFPSNMWAATAFYSDATSWIKQQTQSIVHQSLPVWWAEDYVGKVNGDPVLTTPAQKQPSLLATMLLQHLRSGAAMSLRWGPEEQLSSANVAQGNMQNLYSSTASSGGGVAYDNYYVYKAINDYFSSGKSYYNVSVSPATNAVDLVSSATKTMAINKSSQPINVTLSSGSAERNFVLGAYQVATVSVPTPLPTPTPTPTPVPTPTTAIFPGIDTHPSALKGGSGSSRSQASQVVSPSPSPDPTGDGASQSEDDQSNNPSVAKTHTLSLTLHGQEGQPMNDAELTLHSNPKYASTDWQGRATFYNVDKGTHQLLVDYQGKHYEKEVVVGDEDVAITLDFDQTGLGFSWWYAGIGAIVVFVLAGLFYIFRRKNAPRGSVPLGA